MKRQSIFANPGAADRHRKARLAAGLSRKQAANLIRFSGRLDAVDIERWETDDTSRPSHRREYQRMADAYNVSLEYLEHGTITCLQDVKAEHYDDPPETRESAILDWVSKHQTE